MENMPDVRESQEECVRPEAEAKPNLRQKLAAIRREIHNVEKNGRNDFHRYDYVTASDMSGILGTALANANIIVSRRNMKVTRILENPYPDKPEKAEVVVCIECEYGFLDGDSTEEIWEPSYGEGRDKGDKGGFKAHTGCLKYFLIQAFLLATGDDPEDSAKADEERAKTTIEPANRGAQQGRQPPPEPKLTPKLDADPNRLCTESERKQLWARVREKGVELGHDEATSRAWLNTMMLYCDVPSVGKGEQTTAIKEKMTFGQFLKIKVMIDARKDAPVMSDRDVEY